MMVRPRLSTRSMMAPEKSSPMAIGVAITRLTNASENVLWVSSQASKERTTNCPCMARKNVPRLDTSQRKGMDSRAAKERGMRRTGVVSAGSAGLLASGSVTVLSENLAWGRRAAFYVNAWPISSWNLLKNRHFLLPAVSCSWPGLAGLAKESAINCRTHRGRQTFWRASGLADVFEGYPDGFP